MAGMLVLLIFLSLAVSCEALANCTSPWIGMYKNNCYFFSTTLETWSEARHTGFPSEYRNFWTGGTDFGHEGVWRWDDGHPMTYKNWLPSQPGGKYNENCMYIGYSSHYFWADLSCDISEYYICEKENKP